MVQHDFEKNLSGLIKNSAGKFRGLQMAIKRKGVAIIEATGNSTN